MGGKDRREALYNVSKKDGVIMLVTYNEVLNLIIEVPKEFHS